MIIIHSVYCILKITS